MKRLEKKIAGETIKIPHDLFSCYFNHNENDTTKIIILKDEIRIEKEISELKDVLFLGNETAVLKEGENKVYFYHFGNSTHETQIKEIASINIEQSIFLTKEELDKNLSHVKKMIKIIEDKLEGRISDEYISTTFNGRSILKYSPKDLLEILEYYKKIEQRENFKKLSKEEQRKASFVYFNF